MSDLIKLQKDIDALMNIKTEIIAKEQAKENLKDVCFILDFSGSMSEHIEGMSKEQHLRNMLKNLGVQEENCISFHSWVEKGIMKEVAGLTMLHLAIAEFAKTNYKKGIIISDGCADSPSACEAEARKLNGKQLSSIYIGDEDSGKHLLDNLTKQTGGESLLLQSNIAKMLTEKVTLLLK